MAILLTTRGNRAPIYQPLLVILAFPLSSFWIYWGAKELIDVLRSFGYIWGISDAILAVTILSWGNSIGDAVSDVVVARQGQSKMAIGNISILTFRCYLWRSSFKYFAWMWNCLHI